MVGDFRSPRPAYLSSTPPSSPTLHLQPHNLDSKIPNHETNHFESKTTPNKQLNQIKMHGADCPKCGASSNGGKTCGSCGAVCSLSFSSNTIYHSPLYLYIQYRNLRRSKTNDPNRAAPTKPLILASASSIQHFEQPLTRYGIRMDGKSVSCVCY